MYYIYCIHTYVPDKAYCSEFILWDADSIPEIAKEFWGSIRDRKQGDTLPPLLFNLALQYDIRMVQEINLGLDMEATHPMLAYADDVNLIGDDIRTIERNADVLLNACKDY